MDLAIKKDLKLISAVFRFRLEKYKFNNENN